MVSGLYKDLERRKVRIRINLGKDFELYSMNYMTRYWSLFFEKIEPIVEFRPFAGFH